MNETPATILLVEDDPLLRHAFRLLLEDAGYAVVEAGSAAEALQAVDAAAPALVLLDLGLPDIDGLRVLEDLRRTGSVLPVIVLTAHATDRDRCLEQGADEFLVKPVPFAQLLEHIDALRS